ncbi:MAG TPA: ABC transporter ATP-binding protein [Eggerthellaceae bacterium]|nr:ABC transporter ATP-binding protein [Eggerthellaceae bacterium]
MSDILNISNLAKYYDSFTLDNISLAVPEGEITGFIGSNGAGKTTTIKAILGLITYDGGTIEIFGSNSKSLQPHDKDRIGVVFDTLPFPTDCQISDIALIGKCAYSSWDSTYFKQLTHTFEIEKVKQVKSLSRGMGMKLQLAFALAHHPDLLILDEATAGLDPLARDEVLEMLRTFMNEEHHGILISSHITSDLEKIADYVVCIDKGKQVFTKSIDEICDMAGIAHCRSAELEELLQRELFEPQSLRIIRSAYGTDVLVPDRSIPSQHMPNIVCDRANLEEYMRFMLKGEIR